MKAGTAAAVTLVAAMGYGQAMADGNQLLSSCQTAIKFMDGEKNVDRFDVGYCGGIVEAVEQSLMMVNDSLPKEFRTCFPKQGINNGQMARIVVKFMQENPAMLSQPATVLAITAYKTAYFCK